MEVMNKEIDKEKPLRLINAHRQMSEILSKTKKLQSSASSAIKQQELALSVRGLSDIWLSECRTGQPTAENFSSLENIFSSGIAGTQKAFDFVKAFFDLINEMVFQELGNWLNTYIYIYIYG